MRNKIAFLLLTVAAGSLLFSTDVAAQGKKKKKKVVKTEHLEPWQIDTLINPIPINRQMFTENVEKQIKRADLMDGEVDGMIDLEDTMASRLFTKVMMVDARHVMIHIENLPNLLQHLLKPCFCHLCKKKVRPWQEIFLRWFLISF